MDVDHPEPILFGIACLLSGVGFALGLSDDEIDMTHDIWYIIGASFIALYPVYGIGVLLSRAFNRVQEIRKGRAAKKRVPNESDSDSESGFQPIKF